MLAGRNDAPFRVAVALLRSYLRDLDNRLVIDARLAHAGHTGRAGQDFEVWPGLSLRFGLAATYAALSEGLDPQQRDALDERLGFFNDDPLDPPALARELDEQPAPQPAAPTSSPYDPKALAAVLALGEQELVE